MKLFYFELHEQNGGYEYTYDHLVKAESFEEAEKLAEEYAENFYGKLNQIETADNRPDIFWFNSWTIAISVAELREITKDEFMIWMYQRALVN